MMKLLICISLFAVALAAFEDEEFPQRHGFPKPFFQAGTRMPTSEKYTRNYQRYTQNYYQGRWNKIGSRLCRNSTLAVSFLTQSRTLIDKLQSNGSFENVLQQNAQTITYLEDDNRLEQISSNCTELFAGLSYATKGDASGVTSEEQSIKIFQRFLLKIVRSLLNAGREESDGKTY